MKIIGLTGGIASGKSTVTKTLEKLGAIIIDSDELAHSIMQPYKPAWNDIVKLFGTEILNSDETINRDLLGQIVFNDAKKLKELNQITHWRIAERYKEDLRVIKKENPNAIVVMEIPLLYETHAERICDEVWVVWVDRETQIERLMKRDNISQEDAIKRIEAQMDLDEKASMADVVIDNRHSIETTIEAATRNYIERMQT
ncbi:MAG TPA: dephospho-CoA kinase [Syntrophomonadaceae bacterium]|nr:dephospho-CoA kinase [Syntrophomonadaceae bacterium]HRX21511.1 dephospho-CoA kinase [Syntrophomonadaceae bacterium]